MVGPRICEYKKARLTERCLELVGECTRSVPSSNGMTTSVLSKFQDSPLTIGSCRLDNDILRVLYSNNYTSCKLKLLPGLAKVDDVNSYGGQKDNSITETETNSAVKSARCTLGGLTLICVYHYFPKAYDVKKEFTHLGK